MLSNPACSSISCKVVASISLLRFAGVSHGLNDGCRMGVAFRFAFLLRAETRAAAFNTLFSIVCIRITVAL